MHKTSRHFLRTAGLLYSDPGVKVLNSCLEVLEERKKESLNEMLVI